MKIIVYLTGVLVLISISCNNKLLVTDISKMQLKGNVKGIIEKTFELFPINDSSRIPNESIYHSESHYWLFNKKGYLIKEGDKLIGEDSLFRINYYSSKFPYSLEKTINNLARDTILFFEDTRNQGDTLFREIYFSDSTLFRSTNIILDRLGREITKIYKYPPPLLKVEIKYNTNGLVSEEIITGSLESNSEIIYYYNEVNIKSKVIYYNQNSIVEIKFDYSYDMNLNWISQTEYLNDIPVQFKIRNINYY